MTQAADQQTILQNSLNTEIMLARMDERMVHLTHEVKELKNIIEAKKVSWVQVWGPILATAVAIAGIYGTLSNDIAKLQNADAQSIQQRAEQDRRIERLEVAVIEGAKAR